MTHCESRELPTTNSAFGVRESFIVRGCFLILKGFTISSDAASIRSILGRSTDHLVVEYVPCRIWACFSRDPVKATNARGHLDATRPHSKREGGIGDRCITVCAKSMALSSVAFL